MINSMVNLADFPNIEIPMGDEILDQALSDFFYKRKNRPPLIIHNKYGDPDEMDPGVYFRRAEEMNPAEKMAVSVCYGEILDVGAGVGSISLELAKLELSVTSLEISETACSIMNKRVVTSIVSADYFLYNPGRKFDILLMIMNGIGFSGTLEGLSKTLQKAKELLMPGGKIVFDSSDVAYLYPKSRLTQQPYYGIVDFQYQYGEKWGQWFKWLYVDPGTMKSFAAAEGWEMQILYQDDSDHYLATLQLIE